jgi:hypothetical protein
MNEPLKTEQLNTTGKPSHTEEEYQSWLDEMASYLKQGNTLIYAILKAGLTQHEPAIREKYRLGDWFSRRVDNLQAAIGELLNNIFANELQDIAEAQKQGRALTELQWKNLRFMAERHRSARVFFGGIEAVDEVRVIPTDVINRVVPSSDGIQPINDQPQSQGTSQTSSLPQA